MSEHPPTPGDARVDAAVARLAQLHERPAAEHVAVYEDILQRLQEALIDTDGR